MCCYRLYIHLYCGCLASSQACYNLNDGKLNFVHLEASVHTRMNMSNFETENSFEYRHIDLN